MKEFSWRFGSEKVSKSYALYILLGESTQLGESTLLDESTALDESSSRGVAVCDAVWYCESLPVGQEATSCREVNENSIVQLAGKRKSNDCHLLTMQTPEVVHQERSQQRSCSLHQICGVGIIKYVEGGGEDGSDARASLRRVSRWGRIELHCDSSCWIQKPTKY
ncbi:hypothetical protein K491DRAFT_370374 [Lophiostoma macrostomum CBS 122681]|uniref:Uncharacterized protein n=1 Tax=Lophiostoma macrostomum CBS 122681 TaxID=1314788 RepID=A0A6A6TA16_9PLEO|nr:hypothetical protein K491DRAFT_370374 [Lophiostoma macrostomum CBS 122681]